MIIEGKILQIMEIWPLQLIVETKDKEKIYVTLLEITDIIYNNNKVNLNKLMLNQDVRVNGQNKEDNLSMTANSIEILKIPQ